MSMDGNPVNGVQENNTSGRLTWRIDNISQRMEEARTGTIPALYSQPFFTTDAGEINITVTSHDLWRYAGCRCHRCEVTWVSWILKSPATKPLVGNPSGDTAHKGPVMRN